MLIRINLSVTISTEMASYKRVEPSQPLVEISEGATGLSGCKENVMSDNSRHRCKNLHFR